MLMNEFSPRKDRRAAILPGRCYIPWKGYFDIIAKVDVFVVYDDVQYSENHWHNRNLIKTQHGLKWLTVPKSRRNGGINSIENMRIARPFAHKHWRSVAQSYARAPFLGDLRSGSRRVSRWLELGKYVSAVNFLFIKTLCEELGIRTEIIWSRDLKARGARPSGWSISAGRSAPTSICRVLPPRPISTKRSSLNRQSVWSGWTTPAMRVILNCMGRSRMA